MLDRGSLNLSAADCTETQTIGGYDGLSPQNLWCATSDRDQCDNDEVPLLVEKALYAASECSDMMSHDKATFADARFYRLGTFRRDDNFFRLLIQEIRVAANDVPVTTCQ